MRLLAIWMLCPHAWTKMAPPPCELFVSPKASMLEGLHIKLLGYGLVVTVVLVWHSGLASPTGKLPPPLTSVPISRVVPVGNPASRVESKGSEGKTTPFE